MFQKSVADTEITFAFDAIRTRRNTQGDIDTVINGKMELTEYSRIPVSRHLGDLCKK